MRLRPFYLEPHSRDEGDEDSQWPARLRYDRVCHGAHSASLLKIELADDMRSDFVRVVIDPTKDVALVRLAEHEADGNDFARYGTLSILQPNFIIVSHGL